MTDTVEQHDARIAEFRRQGYGEHDARRKAEIAMLREELDAARKACPSCLMLKKMTESGRITDPVLAGQAALTTRRSLERDRAVERAEEAEARVIEMVEQTDTIPGSDFRKQMAFNQKRYEGACKRADEANDRVKGLEAKVRESREYRVSMAATVERLGRVVAAAREVHMICDRYDELHIDDIPCNECDTCTLRLAIERMDAR